MKLAKLHHGPEIFHTLQGEGPSTGMPAVFIRASRCNLHCIWCDTDHTWNFVGTPWPHEKDSLPNYQKHQKTESTIELLPAEAAALILAYDCPRVVITGGEPLLQQNDFLELIHIIRQTMPECVFEVETNATLIPCPALYQAVDQFNVSPKLANAAIVERLRLPPESLAFFAASAKSFFKFVITGPADLIEIQSIRARFNIPAARILLMPEGRTADDLDRNAPEVAEICRDLGFRYCDRLHIRLWGDQRGV